MQRFFPRLIMLRAILLGGFLLTNSQATEPAPRLTLRECVIEALVNNRDLQIERLNVPIAVSTLSGSYGYYDPVFRSRVARENATDTGGFDPTDFSRDAIYEADSEVGSAELEGMLPMGLSYSVGGNYAHSDGTRNALNFDSYKLGIAGAVRQPLLRNFWTDQGRATIQINRKNINLTELALRYMVMLTVGKTEQAYFEWLYARENLTVQQRRQRSRETTLTAIQRQVSVGQMTALEEKLGLSDLARADQDLITASNEVYLAENNLRTVMGQNRARWAQELPAPAEILMIWPQTFGLSESWSKGLAQRPDLAQLQVEVEKNDINLRYRRNQMLPSIDVVAAYGRRGASAVQAAPGTPANATFYDAMDQIRDADAPNDMVGVVLSVPLSLRSERGNYQVGKYQKEQAQIRVKQREELVLREVADAHYQAVSAFQRVNAARRAREAAAAALKVEEQRMETGRSAVFVVLSLQNDLAEAETDEVRAKADYNQAMSLLRLAEGSILDQNIHLELRDAN